MAVKQEKEQRRVFTRSIHGKLIWTYLMLVGLIAVISVSFIMLYLNMFSNSRTLSNMKDEQDSFLHYPLAQFLFSETTADILYSSVADEDYSLIILDAEGTYFNGRNVDYLNVVTSDFEQSVSSALSPFLDNGGGGIVRMGARRYNVSVMKILGNGETVGYVVLLAPINVTSINSTPINLYIIAVASASMLAVLIASLIAQSMTTNIRRLRKKAECIANRQFDCDIPIKITNDEIGELAVSIDEMSRSLQEYDHNQKIFLQNASHELRTPLMSIRGYVEGVKDGVFSNIDEAGDEILAQVDRLEKLVNNVVYLSKIETADGMLRFADVTITEVIDESVGRVSGIAASANKKITVSAVPEAVVFADADNLAVAITNLITNCLRYAKTEVRIDVMKLDRLVIRVSDDGSGIDPADIPHLFKRFYKGKKGNFGLGLSIVKAVVDAHKGDVYVYNKPDIVGQDGQPVCPGAVFEIAIPFKS